MLFILKFIIYFSISFIILSIPLPKGTLFSMLHSQTNEYTSLLFISMSGQTKKVLKSGSYYTKKIFSNSEPTLQDKVFSKFSSTKKKIYLDQEVSKVDADLDGEKFTNEEKEILNKILKETH
ncbi:MAG: hypothetical protein HN576_02415 [Bacteriovoracaceae bacterium]|jgi:hypothetical protein|nr:hypothetical protein [Bacteriovoracaceae bacterium]